MAMAEDGAGAGEGGMTMGGGTMLWVMSIKSSMRVEIHLLLRMVVVGVGLVVVDLVEVGTIIMEDGEEIITMGDGVEIIIMEVVVLVVEAGKVLSCLT